MFDQMSPMQEDNDLIIAHFNPEELDFMDQLQGGPNWIDIGEGQRIREYSKLRDLPQDPQMRAIFEQAASMGNEEQMPMGMAEGGMPKGIPQEIDEIKSHGRNGDTEVAMIPISLADFFNELIGYDPVNKQDEAPEYFAMGDVLGGIGSGLKSIGNYAGDTLATAAPYLGQAAGSLIGSAFGGDIGSQIGGAAGRGLGRLGQGLWNQEGLPQSAAQGAYQGAATYFQPQLQAAAGMTPAKININPNMSNQQRGLADPLNIAAELTPQLFGAVGGPLGAGIGAGLARAGTGYMNDESPSNAMMNGFKAGAWETGMPVMGNAVGAGIGSSLNQRSAPVQTPPLQMPQGPLQNPMGANMAHGGRVNMNPHTGIPEYGIFDAMTKSIRKIIGGKSIDEFLNQKNRKAPSIPVPQPKETREMGTQTEILPPIQEQYNIPQLPIDWANTIPMAQGGRVNANPYTGFPEYGGMFGGIGKSLGNVFSKATTLISGGLGSLLLPKSIQRFLPTIAGYMLGGPAGAAAGAAIGSGSESMASGQNFGDSLKNAAMNAGMAYMGGQAFNGLGSLGQAAGSSGISSIPASQAGQLMAQNAGTQMAGNAATSSPGIMAGLKGMLGGNTIPLGAMAGMSYMGHRDEQKRLKDWESKEDARRQKYEKAYGTFDEYKMPKAATVRRRPMPQDDIGSREHLYFEHEPLFAAGGGNVPGIGKGQQDNIPARLSPDEYVMDADTVAALGDGSSQAGAAILDRVRENLRKHKRQSKQGIPPKAKPFEKYMPPKVQKKFVGLGR